MRRRICCLGPTDVYLHVGTVIFLVYAVLTGAGAMTLTAFGSILLHECAHALAAAVLGRPPQELELTPLGAVMRLEDEDRLPAVKRLLMLLAGPAMTLLLCFLATSLTRTGVLSVQSGRMLFTANLAILMINLLPALPLDGGRVLSLLLGCFLRQETVRRVMRISGTALGVSAVIFSGWLAWRYGSWNWSMAAVGCFLMYSAATATTTMALHELQRLMDRKIALEGRGFAPVRRVAVIADVPLHRAVRFLHSNRLTEFVVTERGTMRVLGVLTEAEAVSTWLDAPEMLCGEGLKGEL